MTMSSVAELKKRTTYTGILFEPYLDWCAKEGLPVVEEFCVDLHAVETRPWARAGVDGAFVHMKGRGDFISIFLYDLAPGARTEPLQHLYEALFVVVEGTGSTAVELADGTSHSFEWGPNSVFAIPLNARYRIFNGSGTERARLAATNNLCLVMNLIHDEGFIFDNPWRFPAREGGDPSAWDGGGKYVPSSRGRQMWETNFVPDMTAFPLRPFDSRGAGSTNIQFCLADGNIHAHCSEMTVGTYKKGHRHPPDYHVYLLSGQGYSLFWHDDDADVIRFDWKHGSVFAPTDMIWHQHFNTSAEPARYLATAMGSTRYPFTTEKKTAKLGVDVSSKQAGGYQIEYEDQHPRVHRMFLDELAKNGVPCRLGAFMDESRIPR